MESPSHLQLIHCVFDDISDDLVTFLDPPDRVKTRFFQLTCVLPPAATWSRARHSELPGQVPHRSRSVPLGLGKLDPGALERVQRANQQGQFCCWIAEQALHCQGCKLVLVFPEDLGGHEKDDSVIVVLSGIPVVRRAPWRGSSYLCQLSSVDQRRPLGILSDLPHLQSSLHVSELALFGSRSIAAGLPRSTSALLRVCEFAHSIQRGQI